MFYNLAENSAVYVDDSIYAQQFQISLQISHPMKSTRERIPFVTHFHSPSPLLDNTST